MKRSRTPATSSIAPSKPVAASVEAPGPNVLSGHYRLRRRGGLMAATALAAGLPLALAPSGAGATIFNVPASCSAPPSPNVCNASTLLGTPPGNSTDTIAFAGGVLTFDVLTPPAVTYAQLVALSTSSGTLDQDGHDTILTGVISGVSGNAIISNAAATGGSVTFNNTETYTAATTITSGATLKLGTSGNIAASSKVDIIASKGSTGTFDISGATGIVTIKSLRGTSDGAVVLGTNTVFLSSAGDTYSGNISGKGGVTIGGGTENFSNATVMSYTGPTTINSGAQLTLGSVGGLQSAVVADGTLNVAGGNNPIASLSGSGSVVLLNNNKLTLSNASGVFKGIISGGNASAALVIAAGTEALAGKNTFVGTTTINQGATLTGNGSVTGPVVNNGAIRPFDTVSNVAAAFTIGGTYNQGSTGILDIALGGAPAAGNYSKLAISGAATLGGTLSVDTFNSYAIPVGTITFDHVLTYASLTGASDFSNFIFNGAKCTPQGTVDTWLCGNHLTFSLTTGVDRNLSIVRTPEPGSLAIVAAGLLSLFGLRRWRR